MKVISTATTTIIVQAAPDNPVVSIIASTTILLLYYLCLLGGTLCIKDLHIIVDAYRPLITQGNKPPSPPPNYKNQVIQMESARLWLDST